MQRIMSGETTDHGDLRVADVDASDRHRQPERLCGDGSGKGFPGVREASVDVDHLGEAAPHGAHRRREAAIADRRVASVTGEPGRPYRCLIWAGVWCSTRVRCCVCMSQCFWR